MKLSRRMWIYVADNYPIENYIKKMFKLYNIIGFDKNSNMNPIVNL